jgi:hypothetical protein
VGPENIGRWNTGEAEDRNRFRRCPTGAGHGVEQCCAGHGGLVVDACRKPTLWRDKVLNPLGQLVGRDGGQAGDVRADLSDFRRHRGRCVDRSGAGELGFRGSGAAIAPVMG